MRQGFSGKCVQCFWKEQRLRVCVLFFLSCHDFTSCDVMPKISMVGGGFFLHYCFLRKFNLLARLFSWVWMKSKIQTDRVLIRALGSSRSISVDSVHFLLGTLKKKKGCSSAIKMLFKKNSLNCFKSESHQSGIKSVLTVCTGGAYIPPPGHFPHPAPGQMGAGPGPFVHMGGHTATVLTPGGATTVTVLQGEMFQTSPVQTVCPHCQQAIVTRISHDVGLMNTLFCLFCFFVG